MRIFKNKWFNRWARDEGISDAALRNAAEEILTGKVEADLGICLFKKRIARVGSGKRGGYRAIVGYRRPNAERTIFLYGFAKNEKAVISGKEEIALSLVAESFVAATDEQLLTLLTQDSIWEVKDHE